MCGDAWSQGARRILTQNLTPLYGTARWSPVNAWSSSQPERNAAHYLCAMPSIAWYDVPSDSTHTMTSSRVAVLTGGVAVLAAWLSAAAGTVPRVGVPESPLGVGAAPAQSLPPVPARLDLDREVARMAARLEQAPRPRNPARNPFTLAGSPRAASPPPSVVAATPALPPSVVERVAVQAPTVSLAGIGVERASYGYRRTAILSVDGRVFLARVGTEVTGRYQVRGVSDDAVELLDLRDGTLLRLALP